MNKKEGLSFIEPDVHQMALSFEHFWQQL